MPLAFDFTSTLVIGRHFTRSHHTLGQVAFFHLRQLRGINLGTTAGRGKHANGNQQNDSQPDAAIDKQSATLFLIISISVHNRLLKSSLDMLT